MKNCSRCSTEKPQTAFRRCARRADGRQAWCSECQNAYARERLQNNTEAAAANRRRSREWGRANPVRVRARVNAWLEENPNHTAVYQSRHRAAAFGVASTLTTDEWTQVLADFAGRCAYCQSSGEEIDHVYPMVLGGGNCRQNVVPACAFCNNSKHNKPLGEWVPRDAHPRLGIVLGVMT